MVKYILVIYISMASINTFADNINICIDDSWYPYTFKKQNKAVGIHLDIVKKAIEDIGDTVEFIALPWKRCLKHGQSGESDAVVSASYKDSRAVFSYYPDDAKIVKKSAGRIDQVELVLVTRHNDPYEFNGDWITIPQPIGVSGLGSSITENFKKEGVQVIENNTKKGALLMLMKKRVNALSLNALQAVYFNTVGDMKGKLKIHKIPLKSKSYHIIFSKKSKLSAKQRENVWESLAIVRSNIEFMLKTYEKYEK